MVVLPLAYACLVFCFFLDALRTFRPELDKYAAVVGERFFKLDAQPIGPDVRQLLSDWRHVAVRPPAAFPWWPIGALIRSRQTHYIHRAVRALLPCLAAVLHLALLGQPLLLFGAPAIAADTQRFYEALALQQPSLDDRRKRPSQCVYVGESLSRCAPAPMPCGACRLIACRRSQRIVARGPAGGAHRSRR